MNTDKIVPSPTTLAMKAKVQAMQAQMAQGATGPGGGMGPAAAPQGPPVVGRPAPAAPGGGRQLDHAQGPVTESFQNS